MINKLKKVNLFFLISFIVSFLFIQNTSAFELNGYRLNGGIEGRYYYIDSSVKDTYWETAFNNAFYYWNNTNTDFWFLETNDIDEATIVCTAYYGLSLSQRGSDGSTAHFLNNGAQIQPYYQNWDWCRISINTNVLSETIPRYTYDYVTTLVCHEIGHCIGLNHVYDLYSVMSLDPLNRMVSIPAADDINGCNYLY